MILVTLGYKEMLKVKPELKELSSKKRASMDGPVSSKLSYGDWMATLPVAKQKEILGVARYKLFKKGNLSMVDLINQKGNPLTIKELMKMVDGE